MGSDRRDGGIVLKPDAAIDHRQSARRERLVFAGDSGGVCGFLATRLAVGFIVGQARSDVRRGDDALWRGVRT